MCRFYLWQSASHDKCTQSGAKERQSTNKNNNTDNTKSQPIFRINLPITQCNWFNYSLLRIEIYSMTLASNAHSQDSTQDGWFTRFFHTFRKRQLMSIDRHFKKFMQFRTTDLKKKRTRYTHAILYAKKVLSVCCTKERYLFRMVSGLSVCTR